MLDMQAAVLSQELLEGRSLASGGIVQKNDHRAPQMAQQLAQKQANFILPYRRDVLAYAYERCKANGGAAGVDHQTFEDIEQYGAERWLDELAQPLKSQTYQPQPVRS